MLYLHHAKIACIESIRLVIVYPVTFAISLMGFHIQKKHYVKISNSQGAGLKHFLGLKIGLFFVCKSNFAGVFVRKIIFIA